MTADTGFRGKSMVIGGLSRTIIHDLNSKFDRLGALSFVNASAARLA
jgi:hypothetical protein